MRITDKLLSDLDNHVYVTCNYNRFVDYGVQRPNSGEYNWLNYYKLVFNKLILYVGYLSKKTSQEDNWEEINPNFNNILNTYKNINLFIYCNGELSEVVDYEIFDNKWFVFKSDQKKMKSYDV